MSLILRGIDMPKEGEHIVAVIKSNGKCSYWKQDTKYGNCEPMQTVEAIQIPTPHGRLIDEDALIDDLIEQKIPFNARINESIIITPTILEAEEK